MAERKVVEFQPSRRFAKEVGVSRSRKKPEPKGPPDPNAKALNRVFEVCILHATGDNVVEKYFRLRVPKGNIMDAVYDLGNKEHFVGMVSERLHNGKWTPFGFGAVPLELDGIIRELVEEPKEVKQDERPKT